MRCAPVFVLKDNKMQKIYRKMLKRLLKKML